MRRRSADTIVPDPAGTVYARSRGGGGSMFETAPLRVPEAVSTQVAGNPSGWPEATRAGGGAEGLSHAA